MSFTELAQSAKRKHDQIKSPKPDPAEEGPIDLLIVSPGTYPGAERSVWYVMVLPSQIKRANAKAFLTIIKSLKNQDGTGWAMTFDHRSRKWFSLDNEGRVRFATHSSQSLPPLTMRCPPHCLAQANGLKLKDFLADQDVAAFLLSDNVASLTFKAERYGANITTDQIDTLITNQPNPVFLRNWREALQVDAEQHIDTFREYGNLFGAGIPVSLERAQQTGKLKNGSYVVLGGFSHAGDYAAAAVIRWNAAA